MDVFGLSLIHICSAQAERYSPVRYAAIPAAARLPAPMARMTAVSYTHLDVYKRQLHDGAPQVVAVAARRKQRRQRRRLDQRAAASAPATATGLPRRAANAFAIASGHRHRPFPARSDVRNVPCLYVENIYKPSTCMLSTYKCRKFRRTVFQQQQDGSFPAPAVRKTKGAFPPHRHEERKVGDGGKTGECGETEKMCIRDRPCASRCARRGPHRCRSR